MHIVIILRKIYFFEKCFAIIKKNSVLCMGILHTSIIRNKMNVNISNN